MVMMVDAAVEIELEKERVNLNINKWHVSVIVTGRSKHVCVHCIKWLFIYSW